MVSIDSQSHPSFMTFALAAQFHVYLLWLNALLHSALNVSWHCQSGEGPCRDLLCNCETSNFANNRFQLLQGEAVVVWRALIFCDPDNGVYYKKVKTPNTKLQLVLSAGSTSKFTHTEMLLSMFWEVKRRS